MKTRSTNPRMAMMMGRAMRRPALAINPELSVNPASPMPTGLKRGGKLFKGKETYAEELKEAKALKSGKISEKQFVRGEKSEGHKGEEPNPSKLAREIRSGRKSPTQYAKEESKEIKMAKGGKVKETMGPRTMSQDVEKGSNKLLSHGESAVQKRGHTRGRNLGDSGKILAPKQMCKGGYAKGGSASSRADGIAQKGKTKGKMC